MTDPEIKENDKERMKNLKELREADQLIISAVEAAGAAFQALADAKDTKQELIVEQHCARFITDLHKAMTHIRGRIAALSSDLPFENATLNPLINADLAVQRTAHVHRSLVRTLKRVDDGERHDNDVPMLGNVTEELLDASGMTPPAGFMGV